MLLIHTFVAWRLVPLSVLLQCGFVFHVYWFTTTRVEQTVLVQTYTKDNAAKNICSGGVRGQGFANTRSW